MNNKKMSKDIIKEIANLYKEGFGTDRIARKLNLGKTTIRKYLLKENIEFRPAPKDIISKFIHEKIIRLYKKGLSMKQIAIRYNTNFATINRHIHKEGINVRMRGNPNLIKNPLYKKLIPEKAYILGVIGPGDGFIEYKEKEGIYRIVLDVVDKDFLYYFAECLKKIYRIEPRIERVKNRRENQRERLKAVLQSKAVCEDILDYGANFKEKTWNVPKIIKIADRETQSKYIQGFADSQGHVGNRYKFRAIILASKNEAGITEIKLILDNFNINAIKFKHGLRITGRKNLEIFNNYIGFNMKRKSDELTKLINRYKKGDILREGILERKYNVIKQKEEGISLSNIAKLNRISRSYVCNILREVKNKSAYGFLQSNQAQIFPTSKPERRIS